MLRTTSPNISVITNFGCRADCWYCVWKGHELENVSLETDWDKLKAFLAEHQDKRKVSVSGGGDSLYNYDLHEKWWKKFFDITDDLGMQVDVHTREKYKNLNFWYDIHRCVFSSDRLVDDIVFLAYLSELTKVRIAHVVTAETTDEMIEDYIKHSKHYRWQFTIKELFGHDDGGRYHAIKAKYPDVYNLDHGDYNIYYMPDNSIRSEFLPEETSK